MNRRDFMMFSSSGAIIAGMPIAKAASANTSFFEFRRYIVDSESQREALVSFFDDALVPAVGRLGGADPVGIFAPVDETSPVYVLIPHASLESVATFTQRLLADEQFLKDGAAVLDAPAESPAYTRMESSLFKGFSGMPGIEMPVKGEGRIFQFRIYESPSVKTGQKKIEMFNVKEIEIFRKVGLNPVFFGEAIAGHRLPNLTYMLGFESQEELDAAWKRFLADPDWLELKAIPDYADKKILSNITNIVLKPLPGSQI